MIPTRGSFLLASSQNVAGQLRMIALADQLVQDDGRQVSTAIYRVKQGEIVVYQPLDAAVSEALARFQQLMRTHHYELQKELWDQVYDRIGKDTFIATCMLIELTKSKGVVSEATWTRGIDTLLPRTDIVAMVELDKDSDKSTIKMLVWDNLLAISGGLMQEVDCYHVRAFPVAEHLESVPAFEP